MSDMLVITSTASPEARLCLTATGGASLDVNLEVRGLRAHTQVDARNSASSGWMHPDPGVVLDPTERGLTDLLDFIAAHSAGWPDEERWQSSDGKLQLGFSSLGGGEVLMSAVLKQYVPDGWVAYAKLRLAASSLASIGSATRELFPVESA
jgi:hypothetical protein